MTVREGKHVWTGEYACSICGLRFRPDPTDLAKLSRDFSKHQEQHPDNFVNGLEIYTPPTDAII